MEAPGAGNTTMEVVKACLRFRANNADQSVKSILLCELEIIALLTAEGALDAQPMHISHSQADGMVTQSIRDGRRTLIHNGLMAGHSIQG